jgi:SAM-dependent methyltransferase
MSDIKFLSGRKTEVFPDQWYTLAREGHFWMQWRLRAFLKQLKDLKVDLNSHSKVLEIGCGDGVLRRQLEANSSWVIDGADINREALKRASSLRGDTFFYDIFDRRREFAGHYDIIILFDVLEHIADEKAFLEAAMFHLKKGGMFFINVPALQGLYSRYDEAVGHLRRYDRSMMAELAGSAGLEMINMRYWGFSMLPLLSMRRAMVKNAKPSQETIRRGFEPPGEMANKIMKMVMGLETSMLKDPPSGSSLLAAARS